MNGHIYLKSKDNNISLKKRNRERCDDETYDDKYTQGQGLGGGWEGGTPPARASEGPG